MKRYARQSRGVRNKRKRNERDRRLRRYGTGGWIDPYNTEYKFFDTDSNFPNVDPTGSIRLLNAIPKGDGVSERDGRLVSIKSIEFKATLTKTGTGDQANVMRILFVIDKQANGVAATAAKILQASDEQSPRNLDNRSRFIILSDKNYVLNTLPQQGNVKTCKLYKNLNLRTIYNSLSAGDITTIQTNALYVLFISKRNAAADVIGVESYTRIRYTDK